MFPVCQVGPLRRAEPQRRVHVLLVWGVLFVIALRALGPPGLGQTDAPRLSVLESAPGSFSLTWPNTPSGFVLESVNDLGNAAGWQPWTPAPLANNGFFTVTSRADEMARFFRLRQNVSAFQIGSFTPADGAVDVGVTVRPRVVFTQAIKVSSLSPANFYASFAGQMLPATIVPAADGTFAWLFFTQPMPGGARVQVTVDGSSIISAQGDTILDADGDGQPGGIRRFEFTTVSVQPVPGTSLSGIVVDPGPDLIPRTDDDLQAGPDGQLGSADDVFLLPIAGVQVHLIGQENQVQTTQADGRFHFDSVPVGDVKVVIDGTTATQPPAGMYFPEMVIDAQMVLGKDNWTMTNGPEVYLPRLSRNILQTVNSAVTNQVVATPDGAPNLSAFQRNQLSIDIPANSLIGPNGQPQGSGQIGISTVPADVVRDMLPPGVLQHTFDITVQAPGIATFSTPAPMSFPNVFNAAPGTKLNFLSFDHTTGRLVIEGTATVSADGASVRTDPGTGVTHPGWHGLTPPGGPFGPDPNAPDPSSELLSCSLGPTQNTDTREAPGRQRIPQIAGPIKAFPMVLGETGSMSDPSLTWTGPGDPSSCSLKVEITVDGPLAKFMQRTGNLELKSQTFTLPSGSFAKKTFSAKAKTYDQMFGRGNIANFLNDILYGAQIKVKTTLTKLQRPAEVHEMTFYIFRWVNVTYPSDFLSGTGQTMAFRKTLNDGAGGWSMKKTILSFLPSATETIVQVVPRNGLPQLFSPDFSADRHSLVVEFDPDRTGTILQDVYLRMRDGQDTPVGQLVATGQGIAPVKIDLNPLGYEAELKRVIESLRNTTLRSGFGFTIPTYFFSGSDVGSPPAVIRTNLVVQGRSEFGDFLNLVPGGATAKAAGKDGVLGTADDVTYNRYIYVSGRFEDAFNGFMPSDRAIVGPDGIVGSPDDTFSQQQEIDLSKRLDTEAIELAQAVAADFSDVNSLADAVQFVNDGGDFTVEWTDLFTDGGNGRSSGPTGSGVPIFGLANVVDANRSVLQPLLSNPKLPLAAKFWAIADNLNTSATNSAKVAIAINVAWESGISFAEYVANSVSHELGHTFGLLDAYTNDGKLGGTAACNKAGNCFPNDLMRNGQVGDPDLDFAPSNLQLLRASMGVAPGRLEEPLLQALTAYRRTFNLPDSSNGIRENTPADPAPVEPEIAVAQGGQLFFGSADEEAQNAVTIAADPTGSNSANIVLAIKNQGYGPLVINSVSLADGTVGFSADGSAVVGQAIGPGDALPLTVRFVPRATGEAQDTLILQSNADGTPELHVPLLATAIPSGATLAVGLTGNNNLGGVVVGASPITQLAIFQITNQGQQPLQISDIHLIEGAESFQLVGLPNSFPTQPIIVTSGGQFTFGASFNPAQSGLLRGRIEIGSNDQSNPKQIVSVVGTGLASDPPVAQWGKDYVAVESPDFPSGPVLRARSDDKGNFEFFVPSQTFYHLAIFDPETGLIGHETDNTVASGQRTTAASTITFLASQEQDSDYDGLPDDIEFAIGSDPTKQDTDGDGVDDFTALAQGQNPLGSQASANGIVAQVPFGPEARAVTLVQTGKKLLAYVAADSAGLAIVDVTQPTKPVVLSRTILPGAGSIRAFDVAVDAEHDIAAVGAVGDPFSSIILFDVSDPSAPRSLQAFPFEHFDPPHVVIADAIAYATQRDEVRAIDLATGTLQSDLTLGIQGGATATALTTDGNFLYCVSGSLLTLTIVQIDHGILTRRGSITLEDGLDPDFNVSVSDGTAYVPVFKAINSQNSAGGYVAIDVSDPDHPTVIVDPTMRGAFSAPGSVLAVNGAGLGLLLGDDPSGTRNAADLIDLSSPTNNYVLIARFQLPDHSHGAAIGNGYAFIANAAGLLVLNYSNLDTRGQPPQAAIIAVLPDADPNAPGYQVVEGQEFNVQARVRDDVQVRSVELLINGKVVLQTGQSPFLLRARAPNITAQSKTFIVQVRATDSGGNTQLSAPVTVALLPDTTPPVLLRSDPPEGGTGLREMQTIRLNFSEPLADASLVPMNFDLFPPSGPSIQPIAFGLKDSGQEVDLQFAPLDPGNYSLVLHQARITDRAGNPLGSSDLTIHFTVLTYTIRWNRKAYDQWASGLWFEPTNWVPVRVPRTNDWVMIDVPNTNIIVLIGNDLTQATTELVKPAYVRDLVSNQEIDLFYVNLHADNTIQIDNQLEIDASKISNSRLIAGPHTVITRGERCCSSSITPEGYLAAFDNVTMEGDFKMGTHGGAGPFNIVNRLEVHGTILSHAVFQFYDDATIAGPGTLTNCDLDCSALPYRFDPAAGALLHKTPITVTLETNTVLRGNINIGLEDAGVTFINRGQIISEIPTTDPTLRFNSSIVMYGSPNPTNINSFVNLGSLEVRKDNRLQINGQFFANRGDLTVRQGGFLWLIVDCELSKVVCETGAICELNGSRYVTASNAVTELSGSGTWLISGGGQLQGGTVRLTDGAVLEGNPSFSNVIFEGELHNYDMTIGSPRSQQFPQYVTPYGNTMGVYTNATINGRIVFHTTTNWNGDLSFAHGSIENAEVVSLNGNGQIEFLGPNNNNAIDYPSEFGGQILIGNGITVHGQSLTIGNDRSPFLGVAPPILINQGAILTQPGDRLRLTCAAVTNAGVIHISADTVVTNSFVYVQTPAGRLEFDLAGTTPGSTHGQLNIGTTAALDGTLSVSLVPPFNPIAGAAFRLVTFSSATGKFGTLQTPSLPAPDLIWIPQYNPGDFTLRVTTGAQ